MPHMRVDEQLAASAKPMVVQGRNGWLVNQQLHFGPYSTSPVKRGWTKGYNIPFIIRFSGAKEELEFHISDETRESVDASCLGKLREQDLPVLNKTFEVNLKTRDVFVCAMSLGDETYDFLARNLNQNPRFSETTGLLKAPGLEMTIQSVGELEGGQSSWSTTALGYELLMDSKVIAAVETINEGRVWINPDLPQQQRLLAASVAAALLLRSSLAEHNDDLL